MPVMEKELLKLLLADACGVQVSVAGSFAEGKSFCEFEMSGIGEDVLNTSQSETDPKAQQKVGEDGEGVSSTGNASDLSDMSFAVMTEDLESSLHDYIESIARSPLAMDFSDSELYVEQLILAHIRLLINTRDELALAVLCSMPGREITLQAFHEIKDDAQKKNMPMYQVRVGPFSYCLHVFYLPSFIVYVYCL